MSSSGVVSRRPRRVIYLNILLMFAIVLSSCNPIVRAATAEPTPEILVTINISSKSGTEITTAIARLLGTSHIDNLEDDKQLRLPLCLSPNYISVWAPGHYIHTFPCDGRTTYNETLLPLEDGDNVNYSWIGANFSTAQSQNCAGCHSDAQGRGEYSEWTKDGHSSVFVDPYFWTIYMGTDIHRNPGQETRWEYTNGGQKKRVPEPLSLYGPGFRLDYPNDNGTCAYCHAPAAVKALQQGMDLTVWKNNLPAIPFNVETEGVTCDVCHKVTDVLIGEDQLPFAERPGILSFFFMRPNLDKLFYVGPLTDHKPSRLLEPGTSEDIGACSPVFSESKFCAACHYGKFFDTVIYNSYGEWLNSSYGKKEIENEEGGVKKENAAYRSCQDCHMRSSEAIGNSLQEERAACTGANHSFLNFNHNMMNRNDNGTTAIFKDVVTIDLEPIVEAGKIKVKVTVTNIGAGHKFPTDSPLRHLILLVEARDEKKTLLAQVEGPVIPLWGGIGPNLKEDFAGRPGGIYANILKEKDTNIVPTVAFWNPTVPAWEGSDTRLLPQIPVQKEYSFVTPHSGDATITATLIYRYAFIEIIRQKQWPMNDIQVTAEVAEVKIP